MARRCLTSPGTPDLWARLGWLQGSTRNGMKWGTLTLLEVSHSRGYYLKFAVLLVQRVCSPERPNTKEPRALCPGGLYSWWHFTSPANGSGSHDCAPVMWAYGVPCPAMVSPNAGRAKRTSYCTGSSPYLVREKWIQARAICTSAVYNLRICIT